jgi:hypothetical protein
LPNLVLGGPVNSVRHVDAPESYWIRLALHRLTRSNVSHFKRPAFAVLLYSICERKCIAQIKVLKNVQATVKRDFPTVVGNNMTGMYRVLILKLVIKYDANKVAVNLNLIEEIYLLVGLQRISGSDQLDLNIVVILNFTDRFQKFGYLIAEEVCGHTSIRNQESR